MIHLTLQQLSAFLDGELTDASTELIRRHLSECDACTLRFARIEAQEDVLVRILVDEPSDAFFADLAASIAAQCGGGKSRSHAGRDEKKKVKVEERKIAVAPKPTAAPKPVAAPKPMPIVQPVPPAKPAMAAAPAPEPKPAPAPAPTPAPPAQATPTPFLPPAARPAITPPTPPSPETRPVLYGRREGDVVPGAAGAGRSAAAWIAAVVILIIVASAAWVGLHRGGGAPPAGIPPERAQAPSAPARQDESTPGAASAPEPTEAATETVSPAEPPLASVPEVTTESAPQVAAEPTPERAPEVVLQPAPIAPAEPTPAAPTKPKVQPRKSVASKSPATPAPTATPERLVTRPPQNLVPVRTIITETTMTPTAPNTDSSSRTAAPSAQATPAPATSAAAHLVQEAKSASLRAAKYKDPATFEDAASAWERAMPALGNSPEDLAMARRELAQARFQAWAEAPTPARREAAVTAARAYLLYAPPGPERDQAWTWLGRLKH